LIIAPNKAIFELIATDLKAYNVTKPEFETTNDKIATIIIGQDLALP